VTFEEVLTQARAMLQRQGRVSYRALKRQFDLDDSYLDDLKAELIDVHQVAVDQGGTMLIWTGEPTPAPTAVSSAVEPPQQAPLAYTPPYLAEKILTSCSALEGERKQVTVLFADLKGSMELLADRDPEEARRLLDPVLERLMTAVHRYEGTVNQVMGDGIMALFGAPLAHEDHAVRACYAALHMQETIGQYAEELRRQQGLDVQIRVGLHSGEVVVRAIGSDLHMDYTAVGQTTHLAARLEQLARPGTSLLSADTLRLVEGYVEVTPLGPVPVKGLQEPIEVYELQRAGPARSRLQAAAARGLTRFVGRDPELDQLRQACERAEAGQGQVVAVIGEPGVGKSRLFYEFTHSYRTHGWLLLASSSVSYGKATPYLPIIDLLKAYCGIEVHDDARKRREKVTGKLLTLERALEPTLLAFLTLLEVPVEDQQWQALDPPQRRQRTLDALKRLLLRESQVQPLCVVFEDLHWIDAETQALLDSLVESLPTARLLLLVNYRPEYRHDWGGKTFYKQLRLDPLPPANAEEFLQALLGDNPSLAPLTRLLIERTEGNPFFLEESVRTLVETKALVGTPGAYRLAQSLLTIQMPATVQAVLAARIDRLAPEEKRLLQTAAVIGTEVPFTLLQAIAELPEATLHRGLAHLQAAEFLYETHLFPDLAYTFKHALTYEVAYSSLLQGRRRALHTKIVAVLETLDADRLAEQVEWLAHHAVRGEVWEKALQYCWQAGVKAAARSAHREAVVSFEQALGALQHLPESRARSEQAIDLRFDLRNALFPLGEEQRILDHLRVAERLAEALDDHRRLGRVASFMTHYFIIVGDLDRALESGQRALVVSEALGDVALQVEARVHLGRLYYVLGDYRRAIAVLRKNVEALQGDLRCEHFSLPGVASVVSYAWLVRSLAELGAFAEGMTHAEEAVRIAEVADHSFTLFDAYYSVGCLCLRKGEIPKALPLLERALALVQSRNMLIVFPSTASALGVAYALSGQVRQALPLLEQAMQLSESMGIKATHALGVAALSEAYLLAGRIDEALPLAGRALECSSDLKQHGHLAWILRLLGELYARHDPPQIEQTEAHYRQALTLAEELGMRPLQAHCHRGLGMLYAATGQQERARTALSTAMEMYQSMDMTFWLPQTEAALAQVEGR
jgi:class 3 adenylate cyclase/tetratricopeptide (TPR) repeat protein